MKVTAPHLPAEPDAEPFLPALRRPRFVEGEKEPGGAEHGTAMHTFLYHLDLARPWTVDALKAAAGALVARRLLTRAQRDALDLEAIMHFLETDLGSRIRRRRSRRRLWREWAFTLAVELERLWHILSPGLGRALSRRRPCRRAGNSRTVVARGRSSVPSRLQDRSPPRRGVADIPLRAAA